jgi:hypothetical protein
MMRSLVVLSIFTFMAGCGEAREPVDVTVDTFNVALAGAFIPFEAARRPYISEAIAASDADILCLQEVWDQSDKVAIRDAAAAAFPHSAFFEDDLDTPIDDATNQQGQVPPAPTTVPCPADVEAEEGVTVADEMDDAIDCLKANCSTSPTAKTARPQAKPALHRSAAGRLRRSSSETLRSSAATRAS